MRRWYVVYTRPGMERMAQGHLEQQGFTTYLPRRRKERRHARRIDSILVPLFPRYLFVAFDIEKDAWRSVNGTYGVSYLVGAGDTVSAVPEGIVESIQQRETEEGLIEIVEAPLPALVTVSNELGEPRYPTLRGIMQAGRKQPTMWGLTDIGAEPELISGGRNRVRMTRLYIPKVEKSCEFIEGDNGEDIGRKLALRLREAKLI